MPPQAKTRNNRHYFNPDRKIVNLIIKMELTESNKREQAHKLIIHLYVKSQKTDKVFKMNGVQLLPCRMKSLQRVK